MSCRTVLCSVFFYVVKFVTILFWCDAIKINLRIRWKQSLNFCSLVCATVVALRENGCSRERAGASVGGGPLESCPDCRSCLIREPYDRVVSRGTCPDRVSSLQSPDPLLSLPPSPWCVSSRTHSRVRARGVHLRIVSFVREKEMRCADQRPGTKRKVYTYGLGGRYGAVDNDPIYWYILAK